ncbi:MAG: hypothetical protein LW865_01990 [Betaproteobacteria bacterium]|jgi:hypothetical protein|nr:hypothetical protein [Betaproteobacteria bacterium]
MKNSSRLSRLSSWAEANRAKITHAYDDIAWLIDVVLTVIRRTLGGAGVVLSYLFIHATPETTVYQLAQTVNHTPFWLVAFCIAATYSCIVFGSNDGSQRAQRRRAAATIDRASGSSSKSPQ